MEFETVEQYQVYGEQRQSLGMQAFDEYVDEVDEVDESVDVDGPHVELLSPCSSRNTMIDSPVEYNPVDYYALLTKRNSLTKSGTLTDESVDVKQFESDNYLVKILVNDTSYNITISDLIEFITQYCERTISPDDVTVVHLLIYLAHRHHQSIHNLKLCHMGKSYTVPHYYDLSAKKYLISDLKVNRFPSAHLVITESEDAEKVPLRVAVSMSFSKEFVPVTYVDVITHKVKFSSVRNRFKLRFRRLVPRGVSASS